ncbi:hypothetical protein KY316_00895, partial [Candidatus Woesearchaeota archaeon]|nr:hypothetical protein [Candidatus Woesearchaeota archaeon]
MVTLQELGIVLEAEFSKIDQIEADELQDIQEQHRNDSVSTKISIEEELAKHCLENTRKQFDELTKRLNLDYIGQHVEVSDNAAEFALSAAPTIYKEGLLAIHLSSEALMLKRPKLRGLEANTFDLYEVMDVKTLKQKIKAHFMLGELMYALQVRVSREGPRTPRAEYEKVTEEGAVLDERLERNERFSLIRIRLCHDVGAAHKRLYELSQRTASAQADKAKHWLWNMFDINLHDKFDLEEVMTPHEFRRYIRDVEEIGIGCVFMLYDRENGFGCGKSRNICHFKQDDTCRLCDGDQRLHDYVKVRAEFQLEMIDEADFS